MVTVTLRVYEGKELLYKDQHGTVKNPNHLIKIDEYFFAGKFLRLMGTLGYCKVELVSAADKGVQVSEKKLKDLQKVLDMQMTKLQPKEVEPLPMEVENKELRKQNEEFLKRLELLEKKFEGDPTPPDVSGAVEDFSAPKVNITKP